MVTTGSTASFRHTLPLCLLTLLFSVFLVSGCTTSTEETAPEGLFPEYLPVVMIHGALASGDTYAKPAQLLTSNDYPAGLIHVYDWNSLGGASAAAIAGLDALIDKVLSTTGAPKVYLVGHSAGGGLGYSYCSVATRAAKVKGYVHLASNPQARPAGPNGEVPTLNIYSTADKVVNGAAINQAQNVVFDDLDHYQVATSEKTFAAMFSFFLEGLSPTTVISPQENPTITGRVLTLGENKPVSNVQVTVWEVDGPTGKRMGEAITRFTPDQDGRFGPLSVRKNTYHEFEITSSDPDFRTLHYYREPFLRDNGFVYLRTFPPSSSFAGILLSNLPKDDDQAVVAVFTANQAVINGRDSLLTGNTVLSTPALCSPTNSTIALFLYDGGDKMTSGNPHAVFGFVPFLKGADVYNGTPCSETIKLRFNGRTMGVLNYKSASEGVVIAVFD